MRDNLLSRYKGLRKEIYVLFFARIVNCIGAFVHPLLTLIMTDKLGMSSSKAGFLMTVMLLTQLPSMLLGGKLADRFGRLKLIAMFQVLGALIYLVCGLIEMTNTVVILIVIASNCYALTYPALDAMTMDLTTPQNRKEAFSLLYIGINIGFVIGPAVGGILFENHLRLVFIGDAATTLISTALVLALVKETLPPKDFAGTSQMEQAKEGSVLKVLMERKIILAVACILFLFQFSYSQMGFALPIHMDEVLTGGAKNYGFLVGFNGMLVIFATPFITFVIRKWKALYGTLAGGLFYAVAFAAFIFADSLLVFYSAMFLLTMGEILITVDAFAFVSNMSPSTHRGRVNSIVNMIGNGGRMISPLIIGQVIASGSIKLAWLAVSAASLMGAVLLMLLKSLKKT